VVRLALLLFNLQYHQGGAKQSTLSHPPTLPTPSTDAAMSRFIDTLPTPTTMVEKKIIVLSRSR
jgi:hypothetical protein